MTMDQPPVGGIGGIDAVAAREEAFLRGQQRVLEPTAAGAPLNSVLEGIVRLIEAQSPEVGD